MTRSTSQISVGLWAGLVALTMLACANSEFAGNNARPSANARLAGGSGAPDAGDAGDAGDLGDSGPDSGNTGGGLDSDSDSDGSDSGSDSGFDSGGDSDGKDSDDGDDDVETDGSEDSAKTREPLTIVIHRAEDKPTLRVRTVTSKDNGEWKTVKLEKGTVTVDDICWKSSKRDTEIEITLDGNSPTTQLGGQNAMKVKGGGGSQVKIGYEKDGCAISFLAKDCHDDNEFTFSCPKNDVSIMDLF